MKITEAVTGGALLQIIFLEISQNSQENTCARASFLIKFQAFIFIKKETLTQNTFFTEHLRTTASVRFPKV